MCWPMSSLTWLWSQACQEHRMRDWPTSLGKSAPSTKSKALRPVTGSGSWHSLLSVLQRASMISFLLWQGWRLDTAGGWYLCWKRYAWNSRVQRTSTVYIGFKLSSTSTSSTQPWTAVACIPQGKKQLLSKKAWTFASYTTPGCQCWASSKEFYNGMWPPSSTCVST